MRLIKIIAIVVLLVLSVNFVLAENFASQEEFIEAITRFSQEEFGIYLKFDRNPESIEQTADLYYLLYICPKTRFWQETDDTYSFYKYFGKNYPESLIRYYLSYDYDILLRKLSPDQFAQAGRLQRLPDLSKIDVRKINTIFHEGFHYHLRQKGCGGYHGGTIKAMALEEGVATVFGYVAANLFIEKFYGVQSVESQSIKKLIELEELYAQGICALYNRLNNLYQMEDMSDLRKIWATRAIYATETRYKGNTELLVRYIYTRYYSAFENIWQNDTPKQAVEKFVEVIQRGDFQ